MKTFSLKYLMFVTAAIAVLFTVPRWVLPAPSLDPEAAIGGFTIYVLVEAGHGLSICLFFHLITMILGLPIAWRIAVSALAPMAAYLIFLVVFSVHFSIFAYVAVGTFYVVKFSMCSVMAEHTMLELGQRYAWLGSPTSGSGG